MQYLYDLDVITALEIVMLYTKEIDMAIERCSELKGFTNEVRVESDMDYSKGYGRDMSREFVNAWDNKISPCGLYQASICETGVVMLRNIIS